MRSATAVIGTLPGREAMLETALQSVRAQPVAVPIVLTRDEERRGCGWAKNQGLPQVKTEWAAFLDDDDWWFTNHVPELLWASSGADLIYSLPVVWEQGAWTPWPDSPFDADRLREGNYIPCGYMVRTEMALAVGGFPERIPEVPYSDWGFLLRLLDANATFRYVPKVTWAFRRWSGNTSSFGAHPGLRTAL